MSDTLLSVFLIFFAGILLFIILWWRAFKRLLGFENPQYTLARKKYDRLKRIHLAYRILLVMFIACSVIYLLFPKSQKYFYPINWLNNDYINFLGLLILLVAFILIFSIQFKLDKNLHLYYFNPSEKSNAALVPKTESNLLKSILLVYVGMFVVVSTIVTAALLAASLLVYYIRSSTRKYKIKSAMPG